MYKTEYRMGRYMEQSNTYSCKRVNSEGFVIGWMTHIGFSISGFLNFAWDTLHGVLNVAGIWATFIPNVRGCFYKIGHLNEQ